MSGSLLRAVISHEILELHGLRAAVRPRGQASPVGFRRAAGPVVFHLPERGLCHRRLPRKAPRAEKSLKIRPVRLVLPADGAGADQPVRPACPAAFSRAQSGLARSQIRHPALPLGVFQKARHCRPGGCAGQRCHHGKLPLRRRGHCQRHSVLLHSALLRFFRRHRYYARCRADVRHRHGREFPPPDLRNVPDGILAALAHHARRVDARLCVLPAVAVESLRQTLPLGPHTHQGHGRQDLCHVARDVHRLSHHRHLARGELPLYCLRPVERRAHYGLAPAGTDVFALEIGAAHQR